MPAAQRCRRPRRKGRQLATTESSAQSVKESLVEESGLARHVVGLPGVLFQSVTFMAPGAAVATSLSVGAAFAGGALPLSVLITFVGAIVIAMSIGQLARHLPSAGSIYTYPAQGLHPTLGYLVGWGYAMITGLVGPICNLLIGYFVGTILNEELGWSFKATWIGFMLFSALLVVLLGYRGIRLSTWFGIVLGGFEMVVFVLLSFWLIAHAGVAGNTFQVFTLKFANVKGFHGASGLFAGSIYVLLAFVGFEAAAPLAEEAREPRRTVPRAVIFACVVVGIFFLFTSYAAAVYVGPSKFQSYGALNGGSPWILFARQMWGLGWIVLFLAVVNSFFANSNSALNASTRTWYALGRIKLFPPAFAAHPSPLQVPHLRHCRPGTGHRRHRLAAGARLRSRGGLRAARHHPHGCDGLRLRRHQPFLDRLLLAQATPGVQLVAALRDPAHRHRDPRPGVLLGRRHRFVAVQVRLPAALSPQQGGDRSGDMVRLRARLHGIPPGSSPTTGEGHGEGLRLAAGARAREEGRFRS